MFIVSKDDDDEEALYQSHLKQSVLAAKMEREQELKSLQEYEKQRTVDRDTVLGSFDSRKERKYVEKLLDAERMSNNMKHRNMFE